jgi:hypothetical protein
VCATPRRALDPPEQHSGRRKNHCKFPARLPQPLADASPHPPDREPRRERASSLVGCPRRHARSSGLHPSMVENAESPRAFSAGGDPSSAGEPGGRRVLRPTLFWRRSRLSCGGRGGALHAWLRDWHGHMRAHSLARTRGSKFAQRAYVVGNVPHCIPFAGAVRPRPLSLGLAPASSRVRQASRRLVARRRVAIRKHERQREGQPRKRASKQRGISLAERPKPHCNRAHLLDAWTLRSVRSPTYGETGS